MARLIFLEKENFLKLSFSFSLSGAQMLLIICLVYYKVPILLTPKIIKFPFGTNGKLF